MHATEPWTHDPKGTRIIGRTFKVILLTEEKGHEGIWAKVERYLLFEKKFHMLEFKLRLLQECGYMSFPVSKKST